jgi:preprotein translocase subunit SecE
VARSRRRGEDAVDERLDDVLGDEALADSELEEELDEDLTDTDASSTVKSRRWGRRSTSTSKAAPVKTGAGGKSTKTKEDERPNVFVRIITFVREVVAELRKVIWPSRKELLTYTAVVIVFVTIMFSVVAGLDYAFAKAMIFVFGSGTK